jgi:N-acetylmuramoyl-L-alanine amidase
MRRALQMNSEPLGTIKFLTIHCTATPEGKDFTAAQITAMDVARADLGHQIAYHWVIERNGNAVRTLKDTQKGAHTAKANTGNIGVSIVGGVAIDGKTPKDTRTVAQKATLTRLVREYQHNNPGLIVRGHNEWPNVAKACPSFSVAAWLKSGMTT